MRILKSSNDSRSKSTSPSFGLETHFFTNARRDDQEGNEERYKANVDQNVEHIVVGGRYSVVVVVEQRSAVVSKRIEPVQRAHFSAFCVGLIYTSKYRQMNLHHSSLFGFERTFARKKEFTFRERERERELPISRKITRRDRTMRTPSNRRKREKKC